MEFQNNPTDPTGNSIFEDSNIDGCPLNEDSGQNETELTACQRRLKTCKKMLVKCQVVIEEEQRILKQIKKTVGKENQSLAEIKEVVFFLLKNMD